MANSNSFSHLGSYSISFIVLFYFSFLLLFNPFCFPMELFVSSYTCLPLDNKDSILKVKLVACFYIPYKLYFWWRLLKCFKLNRSAWGSWVGEETVVRWLFQLLKRCHGVWPQGQTLDRWRKVKVRQNFIPYKEDLLYNERCLKSSRAAL